MSQIKIMVTGAAGQIACNLIPLLANGNVFGPEQKIALHLLDIPPAIKKLKGIVMEIEDGAYDLLEGVVATDNLEEACKDIDYAILIGGFSVRGSWKNFERSSLLEGNVPIFSKMGKALDKCAKKSVRVVVVANPANTNCAITMKYAPSIPRENFSALSRLDYNRAVSVLAQKLSVKNSDIKNVAIWGNHSRTLIGDASKSLVKGKALVDQLNDNNYLQNEFIEFLRNRFYEIVEYRGVTSSLSAANAVKDHIHDWHFGTPEGKHVAMCVLSDSNPYGIKPGLISSFPVHIKDGSWKIATGFSFNDKMKEMITATEKELESEYEIALKFCEN